jgi:hypothetical protein
MEKFLPLCSPNIQNMMSTFQHHHGNKGYIDNNLLLKFKSTYDYTQYRCFLGQFLDKRFFFSKCSLTMRSGGSIWFNKWNIVLIYIMHGWCLIMLNVWRVRQLWHVMFMTQFTTKSWPLQFVTCNLRTPKFNACYGRSWIRWCSSMMLTKLYSSGSWLICTSELECCQIRLWYGRSHDEDGW